MYLKVNQVFENQSVDFTRLYATGVCITFDKVILSYVDEGKE